ncbi:Nickel and cobalt resistance protein cnrB precursor, putative, partial [Ricinus communis]
MVSAPPGAEATVIARAAGTIKRINKRLGDAVRAGEIIATVDSLEATRMTAMRKSAISKLELAKKVFARESLLYEKGVSPRQDLEAAQSALAVAEAEAAEAQTLAQASNIASDGRSIAVISPADGKITTESTTIGAFVQPETPLFTIANEKQIQINAFITTQDLARVKVGDSATIMSRSDQEYRAKV